MSTDQRKKPRAIALLSGGLDSMLAVKLLHEQGVHVVGLSFVSPFFDAHRAEQAAQELGIPLVVQDLTEDLLSILKEPKHGFGRFFNPCTDCHALMVKKARQLMKESHADFIVTGEVLGQRPKSQQKHSLNAVEKDANARGILLRPLSAQLLPPTEPEATGLIDRDKLLALQGRSRKKQLELAAKWQLKAFHKPAGGCLLTDVAVARRLKRIFQYYKDQVDGSFLQLSKLGRHFWVGNILILVSRDEEETNALLSYVKPTDYLLELANIPGPLTVVRGLADTHSQLIELAALLTVRYSKARSHDNVTVRIKRVDAESETLIEVCPAVLERAMRNLSVEQL